MNDITQFTRTRRAHPVNEIKALPFERVRLDISPPAPRLPEKRMEQSDRQPRESM